MNTAIKSKWLFSVTSCVRLAAIVAAACCAQTAMAVIISSPITLNSDRVVGTVDGEPGDTANQELGFAQHILDLGPGVGQGMIPADVFEGHTYRTSLTDYNGTLDFSSGDISGTTSVMAGWDYVLGKYDGQNAGYVLFYIGGMASTIPLTSDTIWTNTAGAGYTLSHYTAFNLDTTGPGPSVPEGGTTLALLGAAFGVLGLMHRRRLAA